MQAMFDNAKYGEYNVRKGRLPTSTFPFIECQLALLPWNNGKEVPRWGVAEIQKMSP